MPGASKLSHYLVLSALIHATFVVVSGFILAIPPVGVPHLVKVTLIADTAPAGNADFQYGKIVEMPKPKLPAPKKLRENREKPEKTDVLSSFDALAQAPRQGEGLKLVHHPAPMEPAVAEPERETRKHKQSSDSPRASGEVATTADENRFSEVALADVRHDKGGEVSPKRQDTLAKSERETKKETHPLSGDEIDRFAVSNPAGVLEAEGEIVIPFNTRKFEYMDYFASLRREVENAWSYPDEAMEKGIGGMALVRFTVDKSGNLDEAKVISSAGTPALDNAALDAVRRAAPFRPFPNRLDKQKIHIVATFNYSPQYGKVP